MASGYGVDKSLYLNLIPKFDGSHQHLRTRYPCVSFAYLEIKPLCFGYNNCFTLTTRLLNRWPERERPQQEKGKENRQQTKEGLGPEDSPDVFLAELRRLTALFRRASEKDLACAFVSGQSDNVCQVLRAGSFLAGPEPSSPKPVKCRGCSKDKQGCDGAISTNLEVTVVLKQRPHMETWPVDKHVAYIMEKRAILKKRCAEETKSIPAIYDEEAAAASTEQSTSGHCPAFKRFRNAMYNPHLTCILKRCKQARTLYDWRNNWVLLSSWLIH
ncbi:hypothetical protein T11_3720 [Trichinella zimbabwensis]|uniref:Uncharacterized protein n=1 Tax=Trichinella zimbabwensis TaxID=268475 RepID=A0A0V1GTB3_9BILA|nr:hypothetical protein T11_3720 [Trichinella zimbabwensis]